MFYVYRITNIINGHYYIGKRKSEDPQEDRYMGSGALIKKAIQKHGLSNFKKEILEIFEDEESAFELEARLVTIAEVNDPNCYNLHEGGRGGFSHINRIPKEIRPNIVSFKESVASGRITPGGDTSSFFTEESYRKMREGSKKGLKILKENPDIMRKVGKRVSEKQSGTSNSQYGSVWCVLKTAENLLERKKFKVVPEGWITTTEWKDLQKDKSKPQYGKKWFNDGEKNFFLNPSDARTEHLTVGRLV